MRGNTHTRGSSEGQQHETPQKLTLGKSVPDEGTGARAAPDSQCQPCHQPWKWKTTGQDLQSSEGVWDRDLHRAGPATRMKAKQRLLQAGGGPWVDPHALQAPSSPGCTGTHIQTSSS